MNIREFICIGCPVGCELKVSFDNKTINVTGNQCIIGKKFAEEEITDPRRNISMAVKTNLNGKKIMVSVKTESEIPKDMIFQVIKEIKNKKITYAVNVGDVIIKNVLDTGIDIVATSSNVGDFNGL